MLGVLGVAQIDCRTGEQYLCLVQSPVSGAPLKVKSLGVDAACRPVPSFDKVACYAHLQRGSRAHLDHLQTVDGWTDGAALFCLRSS